MVTLARYESECIDIIDLATGKLVARIEVRDISPSRVKLGVDAMPGYAGHRSEVEYRGLRKAEGEDLEGRAVA